MDFSGPYLPHSPVKGVLVFSDLSRTIYKWFDGMIYGLAENQSQSGGFWWLEALASGGAAGAIPVQSTEDLGKALPPCAVSPSVAVLGWVRGSPAARPCWESPCPSSFSRGVSIVQHWHQILLITNFKYIFLKEAFSLIFHGEGHTSVCPRHLCCEMLCPCKLKYKLRRPQKDKRFCCFGKSSLCKESVWIVRDWQVHFPSHRSLA